MSLNVPKTGIASQMRSWMADRKGSFSLEQLLEAMRIPTGKERDTARRALRDFIHRGEVLRIEQNIRQTFRYNAAWRSPLKGNIRPKVLKAMRLLSFHGCFAVSDIQRMAEVPDRSYVGKITRRLTNAGYLSRQGKRHCAHGSGEEFLYRMVDVDRFRIEVME